MPRIPFGLLRLLRRAPYSISSARSLSRNFTNTVINQALHRFSLLSSSFSSPLLASPSTQSSSPIFSALGQLRFRTFGAEYQPSQRKRKRKHGFLARKRSLGGKNILRRRLIKGRKYLSH